MKATYERKVFYSREDKGWIAVAPELPGCSAFGKTAEAAFSELETAMELWLEVARKDERRVPEPLAEKDLTGRFLLRLPKDLHRKLSSEAKEQGVSLNQYLLYVMARYSRLGSAAI